MATLSRWRLPRAEGATAAATISSLLMMISTLFSVVSGQIQPTCWSSLASSEQGGDGAIALQSNIGVLVEDFGLLQEEVHELEACPSGIVIEVKPPQEMIQDPDYVFHTSQWYNYTVSGTIDVTKLDNTAGARIASDHGSQVAISILACGEDSSPSSSGGGRGNGDFQCNPFVVEDPAHVQSPPVLLDVPILNSPSISFGTAGSESENFVEDVSFDFHVDVPMNVPQEGTYFLIGILQFYTGESIDAPQHRYDVAGELDNFGHPLVQYALPPEEHINFPDHEVVVNPGTELEDDTPSDAYDTETGEAPICWSTQAAPMDEDLGQEGMLLENSGDLVADFVLLPEDVHRMRSCPNGIWVEVEAPTDFDEPTASEWYDYTVSGRIDLTNIDQAYIVSDEGSRIEVTMLACNHQFFTGAYCTPFLGEEDSNDGDSLRVQSPPVVVSVPHTPSIPMINDGREELSDDVAFDFEVEVPIKVDQPGTYFMVAALQFYTGSSPDDVSHRYDVANAMKFGERLVVYSPSLTQGGGQDQDQETGDEEQQSGEDAQEPEAETEVSEDAGQNEMEESEEDEVDPVAADDTKTPAPVQQGEVLEEENDSDHRIFHTVGVIVAILAMILVIRKLRTCRRRRQVLQRTSQGYSFNGRPMQGMGGRGSSRNVSHPGGSYSFTGGIGGGRPVSTSKGYWSEAKKRFVMEDDSHANLHPTDFEAKEIRGLSQSFRFVGKNNDASPTSVTSSSRKTRARSSSSDDDISFVSITDVAKSHQDTSIMKDETENREISVLFTDAEQVSNRWSMLGDAEMEEGEINKQCRSSALKDLNSDDDSDSDDDDGMDNNLVRVQQFMHEFYTDEPDESDTESILRSQHVSGTSPLIPSGSYHDDDSASGHEQTYDEVAAIHILQEEWKRRK